MAAAGRSATSSRSTGGAEDPEALPDLQVLLYANTASVALSLRCGRRRAAGASTRTRPARRLRDAGVDVELRRERGLIHNFMLLDEISPACAAAADRVAADLRTRLGRRESAAL